MFFSRLQDRASSLGNYHGTAGDVRCAPSALVFALSQDAFDIKYELNASHEEGELSYVALTALNRTILDAFNEFGIQIMMPAYIADPREPKMVRRDQRYSAPALPPDSGGGTPSPEPESGGSRAGD